MWQEVALILGGCGQALSGGAATSPVDMKIVVSVEDTGSIDEVIKYSPTFIGFRLDRMADDPLDQVRAVREQTAIPLIATLRSREEGEISSAARISGLASSIRLRSTLISWISRPVTGTMHRPSRARGSR